MSKHTPGPWKYSPQTERVYFTDKKSGEEPPICEMAVSDIMAIQNEDEVAANAHLIAAAPELLEALKAVRAWLNDYNGHMGVPQTKMIRAAIAKAEGEKS
jgi:hypothetical protein